MKSKKPKSKEQRHMARLQKGAVWAANYNGTHLVGAYKKKFLVDTVNAVLDLYALGHLTYDKASSLLAEERTRLQQQIERIDNAELIEPDAYGIEVPISESIHDSDGYEYRKAGKNHAYVNGQLLQTNKTFSHLKQKQRDKIYTWMYQAYADFMDKHEKIPGAKDIESLVDAVYNKIEGAGIWIPHDEVLRYFRRKKTQFHKRYMKQ